MKYVALMPLRGGSKSIPRKNVKLLAGRPLFYHALKAAVDSKIFSAIYVSTDDDSIAHKVTKYFSSVQVLKRPSEFATDEASTESVMLHFAQGHSFDVLCLIQATSPFTEEADFVNAKAHFESEGADSLLTAVETRRFFWSADRKPLNYQPASRPRRQDSPPWFMENGAFYFTKRQTLLATKSRLSGTVAIHIMPEYTGLEIDEPCDWIAASAYIGLRKERPLKNIKALFVDVDGTLTDGGMYYDAQGEALKKYNTRDWQGMKLLMEKGIPVVVITAEDSPRVHSRIQKVPVTKYYYGIKDKISVMNQVLSEFGISAQDVAYIGDDIGDLECLAASGHPFCPADATHEIKQIAHSLQSKGGHGSVRELCDMILAQSLP